MGCPGALDTPLKRIIMDVEGIGEREWLCCSCEHHRSDGFWFRHVYREVDRIGLSPALQGWYPDEVGGWVGSEVSEGRSLDAKFVCFDCVLSECEVCWTVPPSVWSADVSDLDGEEPRLSRILRLYSGLERRASRWRKIGFSDAVKDAGRRQPASSLASEDNYNSKRSRFVASENIAAFIRTVGECNVLVGYLTCPGGQSLEVFQQKWKSFFNGALRGMFGSGMWVRERQHRTGDWHAHFVVDAGFDVRSGYPWVEVNNRCYRAVDARLRAYWKVFREKTELYGFGRHNLEPIKVNGQAAAGYLSKYLSKRKSTDKQFGEEKCRLFGMWGVGRSCSFKFSWNTAAGQQQRQKLAAIARIVGQLRNTSIEDLDDLKRELGFDWWRKIRRILISEKPWPADVRKNAGWVFDEVWLILAMDTKWDAPYWG